MKAAVLIISACLGVPGWGQQPAPDPGTRLPSISALEPRDSPATLIERNSDGTLLISLRPQVWLDDRGCVMMSDRQGNTLPGAFLRISFLLEKVRYLTIWGKIPGGGSPVKLDPAKSYRCLIQVSNIKSDGANQSFSMLKIWDGDKLVYEAGKPAQQQTGGDKPPN